MADYKQQIEIRYPAGQKPEQELINNICQKFNIEASQVSLVPTNNTLSELDKYSNNFKERFESLKKAAELLIDTKNEESPNSENTYLTGQIEQLIINCNGSIDADKENAEKYFNQAVRNVAILLKPFLQKDLKAKSDLKAEIEVAELLDDAECLILMTQPRKVFCTLTEQNNKAFLMVNQPLSPFSNQQELENAPEFKDVFTQKLYDKTLGKIKEVGIPATAISISSRFDKIKGPRNFRINGSYTIENNELKKCSEVMNLSIIGSRSQTNERNKEIAKYNLEVTIEQAINKFLNDNPNWDPNKAIPLSYITLITPHLKKEDTEQYELKQFAIQEYLEKYRSSGEQVTVNNTQYKIVLFNANFSVNLGRHLLPTLKNTENYKTCERIILLAENRLKMLKTSEPHRFKRLNDAVNKLKEVLKMDYIDVLLSPGYRRELYIASLVHIIAEDIGVAFGGCMSAKDRAAILKMHIDAMNLNYDEEKGFISFMAKEDGQKRIGFVSTMADLYQSEFHQISSNFNAPGAKAIKTPAMYLPFDVSLELKKRYKDDKALVKHDKIASINDYYKMVKKANKPENSLSRAQRLYQHIDNEQTQGELTLKNLLDMLVDDINDDKYKVSFLGGKKVSDFTKISHKVPTEIANTIEFLKRAVKYGDTSEDFGKKFDVKKIAEKLKNKSTGFNPFRKNKTREQYEVVSGLLFKLNENLNKPVVNKSNVNHNNVVRITRSQTI